MVRQLSLANCASKVLVGLLFSLTFGVRLAQADSWSQPPLHRYEARTIVTGTDQRSRPAGLAICLADALAKVSGDAAVLDEPRLAALHPETIVADYDYVDRMGGLPHRDEEGSSDRPFWLTVRFDPARLDATLRALGRMPFTGSRATVVPVVTVRRTDTLFVLTSDASQGADHRAALAAAADRVDVPMRLPAAAEIAGQIAQTPDVLPLTGVLTWSAGAHGWVADWATEWQGQAHQWEAKGVSFDEAYRVGLRGALGLMAGFPPDGPAPQRASQ